MGAAAVPERRRDGLRAAWLVVRAARPGAPDGGARADEGGVAPASAGPAAGGVTQTAFQAALARLLVDGDFRDEVRARGEPALDADLTALERRRVVAVASDAGLEITRTLHDGWRLSKALLMLPMTCALLGHERLARELRDFWR